LKSETSISFEYSRGLKAFQAAALVSKWKEQCIFSTSTKAVPLKKIIISVSKWTEQCVFFFQYANTKAVPLERKIILVSKLKEQHILF
jgi:hypothetical protein